MPVAWDPEFVRTLGWATDFRPRPWPEIRSFLAAIAEQNADFQYLVDIATSVIESGREDELAVERFIQVARERLPSTLIECPVCGAAELSTPPYATWPPSPGAALVPPYEDQLGTPSYEVCPNCGFEFGNDDNPVTSPPVSFEDYLAEWVAEGRRRFDSAT